MTFRGHVQNGQVVFDVPASLPEGIEVQVSPLHSPRETPPSGRGSPQPGAADPSLERTFHQLVGEWKVATALTSSGSDMVLHPAYQRIIGMGTAVVGLILAELRREPDHWFWALQAITGEDPVAVDDHGNFDRMTAAWINWAGQRGY
jgi:hypothetical protein